MRFLQILVDHTPEHTAEQVTEAIYEALAVELTRIICALVGC